MPERIIAATDGSCDPNPGPCAWAYVIADARGRPARTVAGGLGHGTNQVAELAAILAVLEDTSGPITVHSDSKYAINCLTSWLPKWRRNGWLNSAKRPVANRHLIEQAALRMEGRDVRLEWVRGHNGHPLNEAADQAAGAALRLPVQRTFTMSAPEAQHLPTDDSPGPAAAPPAPGEALGGAAARPGREARPSTAVLPSTEALLSTEALPSTEPAPCSPGWPPERGRSGFCADCGDPVQQYPVDRRWVVLDAGSAPARGVPVAHRWLVDGEGRAEEGPPGHEAYEDVRTRHVDLCPGRAEGLAEWAASLRDLRAPRPEVR